jgi:UMF1 family MFS transporter
MNIATLFFAVWLVHDIGASNTVAAIASSISSVLVVLSIPVFGSISDATQRRKPWVVGFTLIAVIMTALMGVIGQTIVPLIGESVIAPAVGTYVLAGRRLPFLPPSSSQTGRIRVPCLFTTR